MSRYLQRQAGIYCRFIVLVLKHAGDEMTEVKQWQQIGTRQLADCRIFTVDAIKSISPKTDAEHEFYAINTADWVNIVPITADNELVCIVSIAMVVPKSRLKFQAAWWMRVSYRSLLRQESVLKKQAMKH